MKRTDDAYQSTAVQRSTGCSRSGRWCVDLITTESTEVPRYDQAIHDRVRYPDHVHLAETDRAAPLKGCFTLCMTRFYRKIHFGARVVSRESVARRSFSSFHRAEGDGHQRPLRRIPIKGTKGTFDFRPKCPDEFQPQVCGIEFLGIHILAKTRSIQ
jgi:hypothetical protein